MCAFELVQPGQWRPTAPMLAGECSITRNATICFHDSDLAVVRMGSRVQIFCDPDNWRLGFKAAASGDELSAAVSPAKSVKGNRKPTHRSRINIAQALKRLGVTAEATRGRYPVNVKGEGVGGMLIVNLCGEKDRPQTGGQTKANKGTDAGKDKK